MKHNANFLFLFADRSYMLAYRNTCWATTVLCKARCERIYFSLVIWNYDCMRRTKNIGKMSRRSPNYRISAQFVHLGPLLLALGTEDAHTQPNEHQTSASLSHGWE